MKVAFQDNETPARPELSAAKRALLEARLGGMHRAVGVTPRTGQGDVPLTFDQERLWFLHRLGQGGTAYHIYTGMRVHGPLDAGALERALGELVRRHEALRTTFREVEGIPSQVVHAFAGFELPREDLSGLAPAEREAELKSRIARFAGTPFDLEAGPLFAALLVRLGAEENALLLCMHHIVSDGSSLQLVLNETWTLYDAFAAGRPSPLPEPRLQYGDWAVWQRSQRQRDAEAGHLAYWRERLAGAPELLELPSDNPRPPIPSFRGGRVPVRVPAEVAARLGELARAEGATLFMVALAAFKVLLARYSGTDDVVVGTPIAGRTRSEVEEVIGLFMNTLVLRTDLGDDPTFRELVGRVRETVLGGYEHQDAPFERVIAELRPERSLSHSTLFQVLFQLDTFADAADDGADEPGALRMSELARESDTAKLDVALLLHAGSGGIEGGLHFSADLFERGTAERMVEHVERLLAGAAADPDRRISRLEMMSGAERGRVAEWNATGAPYPADRCIHQLFEAQAGRTPDAVALTFGDHSLTYAELDARANRLARHLRGMGVGPEVRVGVCLERSLELMVCILGVMKAGGAYVPMDPGHPADRIAYLLDDSGVKVLLTQERLLDRFPRRDDLAAVAVDAAWDRIAAEDAGPVESGVGPENLAYVIYTSGSTGRPKGVAMHHRGVSNYIDWGIRFYGADRGAGSPVFSSMAVDLTVTNLLPLFAGRPVRLLAEESPVEALADAIRARPGFGLIKITPIHLGLLNTMLDPADLAGAAHTLVIGADFLSAEPTVLWHEHAPGVRLMNEYGPTETVVGCSAYVLPPGRQRAGAVPVGRAIQNLAFHVLDGHMEMVPVGLPGELYIGGAGVARGYLGRPGLSAEKFVPDPFAGPGARMYRTGDRARWLADGNLMILGRTDNQVKVRGYRVELGEIEAVVKRRPEVRDCLVVLREDRPGDKRLVAYVVADQADPAQLREHLRATLPEYMVPEAFVVMAALPQTATGKLDRRTLPVPESVQGTAAVDEPASFLESQLLQVWEDVLEMDLLGPTQNFFELGGNSILALRLVAQVNRKLGCSLPVATLFAGGTVRHMAAALEDQARPSQAPLSSIVPMQPNGSLPPLFCVHPAGRGVGGYVNVVRHLGADQPVFGLQDVGEDLSRPIPQIAREHVEAIRKVQPVGPYHLLGWSFGGFVAYEMALQLKRQGQVVGFLGMLDTMSPELVQAWPWTSELDLIVGAANDVATLGRRTFDLPRDELEGLDVEEQVRRTADALRAQGAVSADFGEAELRDLFHTLRDRVKSRSGYEAADFPGTLTLFRASFVKDRWIEFFAGYDAEEKRTMGWCRHTPDVDVRPVPGYHATLAFEPHARVLAREMAGALAEARARAGSAGTPRAAVSA